MNDSKARIIESLGEFAEEYDIDGIDMELYQLGLDVECDEFYEIVSRFDLVAE